MSLRNILTYRRILKEQKTNPTVLKINEFYAECKTFSYKVRSKRWVTFYDVETAFKVVLVDDEITEFTIEILVRLKQSIEQYQKNVKSKRTPLKALKIIIDSARKSIVI